MAPQPETCVELIRPLRALLGLKQAALHHVPEYDQALHPAAAGLLAELVSRGECRASELAQHRVVDASVVSRQLGQLERSGLISRRPAPDDGRVSLLTATVEGQQALDALRQRQSEWLSSAMSEWSDDEIRELGQSLERVAEDIRGAIHEELGGTATARERTESGRPNTTEGDQ